MINNLSIAFHTFARCMFTSLSVGEMLLPRYANLSTNFKDLPFRVKMALFRLEHKISVLFVFM